MFDFPSVLHKVSVGVRVDRHDARRPSSGIGKFEHPGVAHRRRDRGAGRVHRAELAAEANGDAMVDLAAVTASLGDVLDAGASTLNNIDGAITENRDEVQHIIEHLASIESAAADLVTNLNTVVEENRAPLNASLVNV